MRHLRIRLEEFSHGRDPNRHYPVPEYGVVQIKKGPIIEEINKILRKYDNPEMQLLRVASDIGLYPNLVRFIRQDQVAMKDMGTDAIDESLLGINFTPVEIDDCPDNSPPDYKMAKLEPSHVEAETSKNTEKVVADGKSGKSASSSSNVDGMEGRLEDRNGGIEENGGYHDNGGDFTTGDEEEIQIVEDVSGDESVKRKEKLSVKEVVMARLNVDTATKSRSSFMLSPPLSGSSPSHSRIISAIAAPSPGKEFTTPYPPARTLPSDKSPSPKRKRIGDSPPSGSLPFRKPQHNYVPLASYGDVPSTSTIIIPDRRSQPGYRDNSAIHARQREEMMRQIPGWKSGAQGRTRSPQPLAEGLIDFTDIINNYQFDSSKGEYRNGASTASADRRISTTSAARSSPDYQQATHSTSTVGADSRTRTTPTCTVSPSSSSWMKTPSTSSVAHESPRNTPPASAVVRLQPKLESTSSATHSQPLRSLLKSAVAKNRELQRVALAPSHPAEETTVTKVIKKSHHKKYDTPRKISTLAGTTMHVPDGSDETLTHTRCNICNVWFEKEKKQKIRYHVLYHCPIKQYQCALCHYSHHELGKIKRHRANVHKDAPVTFDGEDVKNHQNVLMQACYDVFMKRAFPNYDTGKLTIGRSINYPNQVEQLHECAICEKRVYKSLTSYHFVDKHEKQLVYNCTLCKFKSVFKQRLEIHYQACHDCDHVGDFVGASIDFRDPTSFLIKDVFPSFVDIRDSECEEELLTMAYIASGTIDIKTKKKLLAAQDGLEDALNVTIPKNMKCEGCHHDGMLVEAENLYDLFFHMKSHMSRRNQWCCPSEDCTFTATTKLGVDLHIFNDHKKAYLGTVVNRWSILQDDWKKLFAKCFPTVAHLYPTIKGIEFDARANEEKYK
ncbi:hypothetical protein PFISCL1PPCAC_5290 [Pristionchus fissidentatus]|uniref:C2H2-type domain-containing protein n=1 Tax=Pristionchus fissidentatus TaxID=1538716 RepID=A0AAV5V6W2_9BILA|nr:hypothetical protein PFISCL1PPCAC_5290 [Pristionchus fissidentatus]